MGSVFGKNLKLSIFGESHGAGIGMVLDGFPAGVLVDEVAIRRDLDRRKPGQNKWSSARTETDIPQVLSGIYKGYTTGSPIAIFFKNQDTHSEDYVEIERHYRPSHADFTGMIRYEGFNDPRGGGHFSGRLTTGMVYAGALSKQLLERSGILIKGHLSRVGSAVDKSIEEAVEAKLELGSDFPMFDEAATHIAKMEIELARTTLDSVGSEVTVAGFNIPIGIGNPIFENIESHLASAFFAIPGVKGVSFGAGFDFVSMKGSKANDCLYEAAGKVQTRSNHSGGVNGGISNGMPLVAHVALRPTASIGLSQETLHGNGKMEWLQIKGRHDPCIGPRALPVVEAMFSLALIDLILGSQPHLLKIVSEV